MKISNVFKYDEIIVALDHVNNSIVFYDEYSNLQIMNQKGLNINNNVTCIDSKYKYIAIGYEDGSISIHDIQT